MQNETIRKNLVDSINEMTRLLEVCQDSNQQFELRIKIRELFQRLDRVIVATLESNTQDFKDAVEALQVLTKKAKEAKEELNKVEETIDKAAEAVGKLEKLLKNVVGLISIL